MRKHSLNRMALTAAAACLAIPSALQAEKIEVSPDSVQGRTEAAIAEFRAAVQLDPDLEHGAQLFRACAECHSADGGGSRDGRVPVIAGQHVSVLVKQLVDFRHDRRWNELMEDASTRHELEGAQDLLDVAAYAQSLPRPNPQEGGAGVGYGSGQLAGQAVYYRECAECHGRLGEGDLRMLRPRLAGQHYPYLMRQLNETAAGGRPGMDDAHVGRIRALSVDERAAVAEFLSRLSPGLSSTR